MIVETIALLLLAWLVIGAIALHFVARFLRLAGKDDEE